MYSKCQKRGEHQVVQWRKIVYLFIYIVPCHPHHLLLPVKSLSGTLCSLRLLALTCSVTSCESFPLSVCSHMETGGIFIPADARFLRFQASRC